MLLVVIRVLYAVVCAGAAFAIVQPTSPAPEFILSNPAVAFVAMMLASQVATLADILFPRKRIDVISAVYFGMLIGWLLSYQLYYALQAFLASVGFDPRMAPDPLRERLAGGARHRHRLDEHGARRGLFDRGLRALHRLCRLPLRPQGHRLLTSPSFLAIDPFASSA